MSCDNCGNRADRDDVLCQRCKLRNELAQCRSRLNDAYWAFTKVRLWTNKAGLSFWEVFVHVPGTGYSLTLTCDTQDQAEKLAQMLVDVLEIEVEYELY